MNEMIDLTEAPLQEIKTFQNVNISRMTRISWIDRVRNTEVMNKLNEYLYTRVG